MQNSLRNYQEIGRDFLAVHKRAMLLDDPGLGKTLQVLSAADKIGAQRVGVIGPAIARVGWDLEAAKWGWTPANRRAVRVHSFNAYSSEEDYARAIADMLAFSPDVVAIDEAHALKTLGANRTRHIYGDLNNALPPHVRRWPMSGTIAPNHNGELYSHLYHLFPDTLRALMGPGKPYDETSFIERFCKVKDTPFGRVIRGSKNTAILRTALEGISIRRRKHEVLTELPPLAIDAEPLDIKYDVSPARVAALEAALQRMGCPVSDDEDVIEAWIDAHANHIATERRVVGELKAPLAAAWAREQLFSGEPKIILGAYHKSVIDALATELADHGLVAITGSSSLKERMDAVDRFQNDPRCTVFVGQLDAAGTVITMTAASRVGIVESAYTPSVNLQFICRAHRLGQHDGVRATMLYAPGTLDETIQKIVARKTADLAELLD